MKSSTIPQKLSIADQPKKCRPAQLWGPATIAVAAITIGILAGTAINGSAASVLQLLSIVVPIALLVFAGAKWHAEQRIQSWRLKCGELASELETRTSALNDANEHLARAEETRREADAKARHLLEHDALTNLPNRRFLTRHVEGRFAMMRDDAEATFAIMMLDLDRFKEVNDTLGHPAGDELLKLAAQRLTNTLPPQTLAARMGGDEFALVAAGLNSQADAALLAEKVVKAFRTPFQLTKGQRVITQASVGVALYPEHGSDGDTLLSRADLALYEAKSFGRGRYSIYSRELHVSTEQRREIEQDLAHAISEKQFVLHFQPRFSLYTRKIVAIEALLRWNHPTRGELQPVDFIPLAETTGQIDAINFWSIEQACREARIWEEAGHRLMVTVNLSAVQFRKPDISRRILEVIDRTGLSPELLELEVTESVCTRTISGSIERELQRIKGMGVQLAIDDFGMGYSSLAYLKWLPFDTIKIDQSFIGAMLSDDRDHAVVKTVITLAKSLKKNVVAEGVETDEQLDKLIDLGCDEVQGFLLGRPMPIGEMQAQLSRSNTG